MAVWTLFLGLEDPVFIWTFYCFDTDIITNLLFPFELFPFLEIATFMFYRVDFSYFFLLISCFSNKFFQNLEKSIAHFSIVTLNRKLYVCQTFGASSRTLFQNTRCHVLDQLAFALDFDSNSYIWNGCDRLVDMTWKDVGFDCGV